MREKWQLEPVDEEKSFLEHLDELRTTLIRMVVTLLICTLGCIFFASEIMEVMRYPVNKVWDMFEKQHLPSHIDNQAWEIAKESASSLATLDTRQRELYFQNLTNTQKVLVESAVLLRGAQTLAPEKQVDFIKNAASTAEVSEIALSLYNSKAILTDGSGRGALKLMSAFQPGEAFMLSIKLSLYTGIVISFPLLLYFLLQFIIPGLHKHERKLLYKCLGIGFGLFLSGTLFCYFIVLPRVLTFFYTYSLDFGIANEWRIGYYLSFATQMILMFGLAFELPVIVMPFVKLGILTYDLMKATRRYAVVAIMVIAAIITPTPDIATLLLMAVPMYALYELCILFAWWNDRQTKSQALADIASYEKELNNTNN